MGNDGLINCKKCGTLFFKNSGREICEECFKKELDVIDAIVKFVVTSSEDKVTIDEVSAATGVSTDEIEDLITRGRLFKALPKLLIKCRFCGAALEDTEKTGFTCKKCLLKFSPKVNELEKKGLNVGKYQAEAKLLNRRLRGGIGNAETNNRYGFIQNYDL